MHIVHLNDVNMFFFPKRCKILVIFRRLKTINNDATATEKKNCPDYRKSEKQYTEINNWNQRDGLRIMSRETAYRSGGK